MTIAALRKKTFNWGCLTAQRFSPLLSWQEHSSTQTDKVLERWFYIQILRQQKRELLDIA